MYYFETPIGKSRWYAKYGACKTDASLQENECKRRGFIHSRDIAAKELLEKLHPLQVVDGCSKAEEALHRIAASDIIKWDADTQEEYEREFMPWAKQIAKEALGIE